MLSASKEGLLRFVLTAKSHGYRCVKQLITLLLAQYVKYDLY